MNKRNAGINDLPNQSGEQSHRDGNSGIDNRLDGEQLPEPPDSLPLDQLRKDERRTPAPDKRNADIV